MSLNNNQDSVTFELEYKATNDSQIKLFDSSFIDKNKDKCKIIYNAKEYDLMEYFTSIIIIIIMIQSKFN